MPVLVVDDDAINLHAVAETLRKDGYEVVTAANGREALAILARQTCRMVLTDWIMPELNGLELCQAIREGDFGGYIYVIVISSLTDRRDATSAFSSGADGFLSKPWHPRELLARVRAGDRVLAATSGGSRAIEEPAWSRPL
jgi:DNA-binding response OmpR family regulator